MMFRNYRRGFGYSNHADFGLLVARYRYQRNLSRAKFVTALLRASYDLEGEISAHLEHLLNRLSEQYIRSLEEGHITRPPPPELPELITVALGLSPQERDALYLTLVPKVGPLATLHEVGIAVLHPDTYKALLQGAASQRESPLQEEATLDKSLSMLTRREREVLRIALSGVSNQQIADRLRVTKGTVDTHWIRIRRKLGLSQRKLVLDHARKAGWFSDSAEPRG